MIKFKIVDIPELRFDLKSEDILNGLSWILHILTLPYHLITNNRLGIQFISIDTCSSIFITERFSDDAVYESNIFYLPEKIYNFIKEQCCINSGTIVIPKFNIIENIKEN